MTPLATSNFSRWGRQHWPGAVSIARHLPQPPRPPFTGPQYLQLAPSAELLAAAKQGALSWEEYRKRYWWELADIFRWPRRNLVPHHVLADLQALVPPGAQVVLLCHEGRDDVVSGRRPCHRRLVAAWLGKALGVEVPEL